MCVITEIRATVLEHSFTAVIGECAALGRHYSRSLTATLGDADPIAFDLSAAALALEEATHYLNAALAEAQRRSATSAGPLTKT